MKPGIRNWIRDFVETPVRVRIALAHAQVRLRAWQGYRGWVRVRVLYRVQERELQRVVRRTWVEINQP